MTLFPPPPEFTHKANQTPGRQEKVYCVHFQSYFCFEINQILQCILIKMHHLICDVK